MTTDHLEPDLEQPAMDKPVGYYWGSRPELDAFIPKTVALVLDVGCAEGKFGSALKMRRPGIQVWGIEPLPEIAVKARDRLDRVIDAPVEIAMDLLPNEQFDCISFNDCLEHLVDPWAVLKKMRTKLSPDGCVVASIPNIRFYPVLSSLILKGTFSYVNEGILDRTHLRFFTKSSIHTLFEESGYRVEKIEGINAKRLPFWFSQFSKLSRRRFHDMEFLQFAVRARPVEA